jgi:hypothetical protein
MVCRLAQKRMGAFREALTMEPNPFTVTIAEKQKQAL